MEPTFMRLALAFRKDRHIQTPFGWGDSSISIVCQSYDLREGMLICYNIQNGGGSVTKEKAYAVHSIDSYELIDDDVKLPITA